MTLTASEMLPLNTKAPDFRLLDTVSGKKLSLTELKSNVATVVMFLCNHCPYVLHIQKELLRLCSNYQAKGVRFIAISSNDAERYPEDGPDKMKEMAEKKKYPFPYLYDPTQKVAKSYHAACTPDFYVFDKELLCVYRGRFDPSSPGNAFPVTGEDLAQALDAILEGKPVNPDQKPSMGCNIKWKITSK